MAAATVRRMCGGPRTATRAPVYMYVPALTPESRELLCPPRLADVIIPRRPPRLRLQAATLVVLACWCGTCGGSTGRCSPAGVYFASRDTVGRTDPIALNASKGVSLLCPPGAVQGMVASTLRFWKNETVCRYPNGSLWKEGGQTAIVGLGCHTVEWSDPPPRNQRFLWCRSGTPKQCVPPVPPPRPPPRPPPPPYGPLYDPLPRVGVHFTSSDSALQGIVDHATSMAKRNVKPFRLLPDGRNFSVMEEGAQFHAAVSRPSAVLSANSAFLSANFDCGACK
eukprot:COSAG01_NODE_157_length_23722_cov_85.712568_4_plen_281_part_00